MEQYPKEGAGKSVLDSAKKDPDNYDVGKNYSSGFKAMPGCADSGKTSSYNKSANQKGNMGC